MDVVPDVQLSLDNRHLRKGNASLFFIEIFRNMLAKMPLVLGMNIALLKRWDKNFKMPDEKTLTELKIALSVNTFAPALIKLATRHFDEKLQNKTVVTITHIMSFLAVSLSTTHMYRIYLKHLRGVDHVALRRVMRFQMAAAFPLYRNSE